MASVHQPPYQTRSQVYVFENMQSRAPHSANGYLSPIDYELQQNAVSHAYGITLAHQHNDQDRAVKTAKALKLVVSKWKTEYN